MTEVVATVLVIARTQTLVVLDFPLCRIQGPFHPLFVLRDGKEVDPLLGSFPDLRQKVQLVITCRRYGVAYSNDGRHELHKKLGKLQQRRVEVVQEVD